MKPQLAPPLAWGLLTAKLRKECDYQCEDCGLPEDVTLGQPLRLAFKDGKIANRDRSNLLMLCRVCIRRLIASQRRGRIISIYQLSLSLDP